MAAATFGHAMGDTLAAIDVGTNSLHLVVARITGQAAIALSQSGTVASPMIHHSVSFPTSGIDGRTVGELEPSGNPAREIAELWTYVSARLRKSVKVAA